SARVPVVRTSRSSFVNGLVEHRNGLTIDSGQMRMSNCRADPFDYRRRINLQRRDGSVSTNVEMYCGRQTCPNAVACLVGECISPEKSEVRHIGKRSIRIER